MLHYKLWIASSNAGLDPLRLKVVHRPYSKAGYDFTMSIPKWQQDQQAAKCDCQKLHDFLVEPGEQTNAFSCFRIDMNSLGACPIRLAPILLSALT